MCDMCSFNISALTFNEFSGAAQHFRHAYKCVKNPEMTLEDITDEKDGFSPHSVTFKFINDKGEYDNMVTEFDGRFLHVHVGIKGDCRIATVIPVDVKDILSYTAEY